MKQKEELDYDQDIQIDQHKLDREWVLQPQLFLRYMQAAADARQQMDEAKEMVDLTRAQLDTHIRQSAGDKKPTEGAITAAIQQSTKYQVVTKSYLEVKNRWEVLKGVTDAFDQRRAALENLVKLFGMGYFSTPRENEAGAEGLRRTTREAIRERMGKDE